MTYKCSACKKEFTGKRHKKSRFVCCSLKCWYSKPKRWTEKQCLVCSKTFRTSPNWIKRGGGKYCSWKCSSLSKVKEKIERACEVCLTVFTVRPCAIKYNASRFCSHKCADKGNMGENHYFWKGGVSFLPYPPAFNQELKDGVRKRDGYVCQGCGMENEEHILLYNYDLTIHHIDYVKENCSKDNLITACHQCNSRANFNREHWTEFFKQKMLTTMEKST